VNPPYRHLTSWGLSRNAWLLTISTGIMAVSFFGISSVLKILYVLRLGYGLEYVGMFGAMGAVGYMLMSLPSGALGSRLGAQRIMQLGGMTTILGMAVLPLTEFTGGALRSALPMVSQLVLTGGWAMYSVNMVPALMAATTVESRSSAYALNSVFRGLGTFIGAIVGGLLPGLFALWLAVEAEAPAAYRYGLWFAAAFCLLGLLPLSLNRAMSQRVHKEDDATRGPFPVGRVALLAAFVYLSHGAWATSQTFVNAYMDTDLRLSTASIGLILGIGQFLAMLTPLLAPVLARRNGNGQTLMTVTLGTAVCLLPMALFTHWLPASLGLWGVVALGAIWMPALQVYQMELVEAQWRSLAYGILSMVMGFTFASISFAGGYIAAAWGYRSLFGLGVCISLAGAIFMWGLLRTPRPVAPQISGQVDS
jgi:MFS family permease